jgi:CO/xanthine dehydrogenase Mo-binding subunit
MGSSMEESFRLGQALYEAVVYDEDGQLLTGSLMNYALRGPPISRA